MTAGRTAEGGKSRRLTEISRALTYATSLQEVLDLTTECATDLLETPTAVLMLTEDDDMLHIRAARGIDAESAALFSEPLDENLLSTLSGLLGPDVKERFLGVPLVVRGEVIGLLGVLQGEEGPPEDESEWLLSALADQAAVALTSTRHQEIRTALEDRVEQLERGRAQKDQAFEILSHDLRSPLNAIQGYVSLLSGEVLGPVNDRQRESLLRIKRVGDHLESILANVLEMARLAGGRVPMELRPVRIERVVSDALEIVQPAAVAAEIELEAGGEELPEADTDPHRLRQVLVHLLDNAVKYSPDHTRVTVHWRMMVAGGHPWFEISVSDQGQGIPPEQQSSIFEPYVRRPGSTDRSRSGVGLGLAISTSLIQSLGGTLALESRQGEGSTFRVRLPPAARDAGAADEPPPA